VLDAVPLENRTTCQEGRSLVYPRFRSSSGFTLLELLIVVAIIGVLAAVGIPMYNGYISNAKRATAITNYETVQTIVESTMVKCLIPGGVINLVDKTGTPKTISCPDFGVAWPDANWRQGSGATAVQDAIKDHLEGIGMENPYDTGKAVTVGNANGVIQFGGADHVMTFQMSYIDAEGADQKMQYVKYLKDWE